MYLYEHGGNVEAANLDTGFRKIFLEANIFARKKIYHTPSFKSSVELKALLKEDVGMEKMFYKFYHHGELGDSPNVPTRIEVSTCVVRFIIVLLSPY